LVEQDISIKKYGQKNDDLKASLSELQNQLAEKQKRLDSIFAASESFELKPGQVKTLAGYGVVVGLIDVGVDNTIAVSVNNGRAKMYPGTIQTITTNGKTYRLIVKGVSVIPSSASFDFVVNK
ncbi:MAG: hypothetical protein JF614_23635, partial [Acidobacteria bacterium]|nr:hypothetical protein [Acidobacteriota bacterium]